MRSISKLQQRAADASQADGVVSGLTCLGLLLRWPHTIPACAGSGSRHGLWPPHLRLPINETLYMKFGQQKCPFLLLLTPLTSCLAVAPMISEYQLLVKSIDNVNNCSQYWAKCSNGFIVFGSKLEDNVAWSPVLSAATQKARGFYLYRDQNQYFSVWKRLLKVPQPQSEPYPNPISPFSTLPTAGPKLPSDPNRTSLWEFIPGAKLQLLSKSKGIK